MYKTMVVLASAAMLAAWMYARDDEPGGGGASDRSSVAGVMRDLLATPDIVWAVFDGAVAMEGYAIEGSRLGLSGDWVAIENDSWHLHMNAAEVARVRCAKTDDSHRAGRLQFSVAFRDARQEQILGAYFTNMYDESGALRPDRVARFERLCERHDLDRAEAGEPAPRQHDPFRRHR